MRLLLLATAGGALGAGARHLVNIGFARWTALGLPWSTLLVNVIGCGLMGALYWLLTQRWPEAHGVRVFLGTGILGGFTTFSAYTLDFWMLLERKHHLAASLYLVGSVAAAVLAFVTGLVVARWVSP